MAYFTEKELACKCCGVDGTTIEFKTALDKLRGMFGKPMIVNCAYRCSKHNAEVAGSKGSYHVKGEAIDIKIPNGAYRTDLVKLALSLGWSVGIYKNFIHLDIRPEQMIFWGSY